MHIQLDPAKLREDLRRRPAGGDRDALRAEIALAAIRRIEDLCLDGGIRAETQADLEAILRANPSVADIVTALLPVEDRPRELAEIHARFTAAHAAIKEIEREALLPHIARALFAVYGSDEPLPPPDERSLAELSITAARAREAEARR